MATTQAPQGVASPLDRHASPASTQTSSGRTTAALILGIIGVLGALMLPILGLILGIVAVALVGRNRGRNRPWQATAGFWLGVVAIVGSVINMIVAAVIIAS
jgi:uncharacterized protein YqgC (DUF456 family)